MNFLIRELVFKLYAVARLRGILRRIVLRLDGGEIRSETIRQLLVTYHGISLGRYSYGALYNLPLSSGTEIGAYTSIGPRVQVFRRNHPAERLSLHPYFYNSALRLTAIDTIEHIEANPLQIGNDVWIGAGAIILPKCKCIGNGAIVGAGAVVTRDVEDFAIVAGNPARKIADRFQPSLRSKLKASRWWGLAPEALVKIPGILDRPLSEDMLDEIGRILSEHTDPTRAKGD